MLGKELSEFSYATEYHAKKKEAPTAPADAPSVLRIRQLGLRGSIAPFDLDLSAGEVLGSCRATRVGQDGDGEAHLRHRPPNQGEVQIKGKKANISSTRCHHGGPGVLLGGQEE